MLSQKNSTPKNKATTLVYCCSCTIRLCNLSIVSTELNRVFGHRHQFCRTLEVTFREISCLRMLPFEQELTLHSVTDVDQFPLLDSFHWEILRMFPGPPFYVKVSVTEAFFQKDGML